MDYINGDRILEAQGRCPLDLDTVKLQYRITNVPHMPDSPSCPHCDGSPVRFTLIGLYQHDKCVHKFRLLYRSDSVPTAQKYIDDGMEWME